jgi:hypothetical protein
LTREMGEFERQRQYAPPYWQMVAMARKAKLTVEQR